MRFRRLLLLLGAGLVMACEPPPTEPPDDPVFAVQLSLSIDSLYLSTQLTIAGTVLDASGRPVIGPITWSSTDATVASVAGGTVTARKPGTTRIVARYAGAADSATIRVLAPVGRVRLSQDTLSVPLGYYRTISVATLDAGGGELFGRPVTWTSLDTSVVLAGGRIFGNHVGSATVVAASESRADTVRITIVRVPYRIAVTASADSVPIGGTVQLAGTIVDYRGVVMPGPITWRTDPIAATIDSSNRMLVRTAMTFNVDARAPGSAMPGASTEVAGGVAVIGHFQGQSAFRGVDHGCVLTMAGQVACFGSNSLGVLGVPPIDARVYDATLVDTAHFVALPPTNGLQQCALKADGEAWCWGLNDFGQAGAPASHHTGRVNPVATAVRFVALAIGGEHTCGLDASGAAWCWGRESGLETGPFVQAPFNPTPTAVLGGHHFTKIGAGHGYTCGLDAAGKAWCWGANGFALLGNGDSLPSAIPVAVAGGHTFTDISVASFRACGLDTSGEIHCWGRAGDGLDVCLTNPVFRCNRTPVALAGAAFVQIFTTNSTVCGRTAAGALLCRNTAGQYVTTAEATYQDPSFADQVCGRAADNRLYCSNAVGGAPIRIRGQR